MQTKISKRENQIWREKREEDALHKRKKESAGKRMIKR